MFTSTITVTAPRVWPACLNCYNNGRLVGQWLVVCVWVSTGCYTAEGAGDIPSLSDFEDAYQGQWDSFRDYAEQLARRHRTH